MECKLLDCHESATERTITPFGEWNFCGPHREAIDALWPREIDAAGPGQMFTADELPLRDALIDASRYGPGADPSLDVDSRPVDGPVTKSFGRPDGVPVG